MVLQSALATLYGGVVRLRLEGYRRGLLSTHQLKRPVISVGNITLGGTGKTPFVAYLARLLQRARYQPSILSRGYGGKAESRGALVSDGTQILCGPEEAGDEPFWLAETLPGVPVAVGRSRLQSGRLIEERFPGTIHLLDDGFQHLALKRNLNILLLDGTDPFGGGALLPSGRMREPLSGLSRADLIVVTRSHLPLDIDRIEMTVRRYNQVVPISYFYHDAVGIWELNSRREYEMRRFLGKKLVALAAIGNPKIFLHDLGHYQMQVVQKQIFRDHHNFTQSEFDSILEASQREGAEGIITTEKDAVRLQRLQIPDDHVFVLKIEAKPEEPEDYTRFLLAEVADLVSQSGSHHT